MFRRKERQQSSASSTLTDLPTVARYPMVALHVSGSQAEMGAMLGELMKGTDGWQPLVDFYPQMAARTLSMRFPPKTRRVLEGVLQRLLESASKRMDRYRRAHYPEYAARADALLAAAGLPSSLARTFLVMDAFQNAISALARVDRWGATGLAIQAVPACSSLAVWDASSNDGTMRHARNFDFPGVGVWDAAPSVVFCRPTAGLRYGYVSARGADVPGVTAFNEAGITVTAHTRFHRDISLSGACAVDIGHEIVRNAHTIDDAIRVAKSMKSASTWGYLVSSAKEKDAVLVEMNASRVEATRPLAGTQHLACTNRYRHPAFHDGEVITTPAFIVDSNIRFQRLEQTVADHPGGVDRATLEALLGDVTDPHAAEAEEPATRLCGNCIMSPLTVQSIVAEPESEQIRVSVGLAPTGMGPYQTVQYNWDAPDGLYESTPMQAAAAQGEAAPHSEEHRQAVAWYVEATRRQFEGQPLAEVRAAMGRALELAPAEPHFQFLVALLAVSASDLSAAAAHLVRAQRLEAGPYRRGLVLLWQARVASMRGETNLAATARTELLACTDDATKHLRDATSQELHRPKSLRQLQAQLPDLILIDAV